MKWYRAKTYARTEVGTDALHNPIFEEIETGESILVRLAPTASNHDSTEGNSFDEVERTYLTKARRSLLEDISSIEVKGRRYEVIHVTIDSDPSAIRVRRCKDGTDINGR